MSHERPLDRRSYGKLLDLAFVPQCVFKKSIHAVARPPSGHRQKFVSDHQSGCLVQTLCSWLPVSPWYPPTKLPGVGHFWSAMPQKIKQKKEKKEKLFDWPIDWFGSQVSFLVIWIDLDLKIVTLRTKAGVIWISARIAEKWRPWCGL